MKLSVDRSQKATIHFVNVSGTHPYNEYIRISDNRWLRRTPTGHYEEVYDPQELELEFQYRQPKTLYDIITERQQARTQNETGQGIKKTNQVTVSTTHPPNNPGKDHKPFRGSPLVK